MRWRRRVVPLLAGVVTLLAGLGVDAAAGGPVGDKAGDAVYATLLVMIAWLVRPQAPVRGLAGAALVWCVAVELLQLSDVPAAVGARAPVARLVLGSGFDLWDLPAYAVGVLVGAGVVVARRRLHRWAGARRP